MDLTTHAPREVQGPIEALLSDARDADPPHRVFAGGGAIPDKPAPDVALLLFADLVLGLRQIHAGGAALGLVAPALLREIDGRLDRIVLADLGLLPGETPLDAYRAPELAPGRVDACGDLYGLGRTLFELTTGEQPQPGDLPSHLAPVAPLVDRIYAACHVRRDRRYPTIDALIDDILPARPPSGAVDATAIAAALAPEDDAQRTAPRSGPSHIDPLSRPVQPPAPEALARLETLLDDGERAMHEATARTRLVITLSGLGATVIAVLVASWPGLLILPMFVLLRMVQGDLRQRTWFVDVGRPELLAFCDAEDHPPLFVWQHVARSIDRWPTTWTWIRTCEEDFLPDPMQSPPRRMGGVSRVPD